jgi:hypothetical protein
MVLSNLEIISQIYLKRLQFYLIVISSSKSDFVLLNFLQSLQPLVGNLINVVHH